MYSKIVNRPSDLRLFIIAHPKVHRLVHDWFGCRTYDGILGESQSDMPTLCQIRPNSHKFAVSGAIVSITDQRPG